MTSSNQSPRPGGLDAAAWATIVATALSVLAFFGIKEYTDVFDPSVPPANPTVTSRPPIPSNTEPVSPTSAIITRPPVAAPPAISHQEYVRLADGVCAKWFTMAGQYDQSQGGSLSAGGPRSPQDWNFLVANYSSMIGEWESIPMPPGEEAEIESILNGQKLDLDAFRAAGRAAAEGDNYSMTTAINRGKSDEGKQIAQARAFGLNTCG
jgi:hypothetical protein